MNYLLAAVAAATILSKRGSQRKIPARIPEEIAVCRRISRKCRNFFELPSDLPCTHASPLPIRKQLQHRRQATIFKSFGMAVEHVAAALLVYRSTKNNRERKESGNNSDTNN